MKKTRELYPSEKIKKKLSPGQIKKLKEWAKKIYAEVDDDEVPDICIDEIYCIAYTQASIDIHSELWPMLKQRKELLKTDLNKIYEVTLASEKINKLDKKISLFLMGG